MIFVQGELIMYWKYYNVSEEVKIRKIYSFFYNVRDAGFECQGETHDFWECVYVIEGNVSVTADDQIYNLKSNDIIFHRPMELHKYHVVSDAPARLLIFSFSLEGKQSDFFHKKVFHLTGKQCQLLSDLLEYAQCSMTEESTKLDPYNRYLSAFNTVSTYSQTVGIYLQLLFLSIIENNAIINNSSSEDALIFKKAVQYMKKNISQTLPITFIAKEVSVSLSRLKRIFNKYAGISVHRYFLLLKLNKVKELMEQGEPLNNIATQLGFSSQAYLSTAYKREFGVSPSGNAKSPPYKGYDKG